MSNDPRHGPNWLGRCYLWATQRLYNELAWAYDAVSWLVSFGRWSPSRRRALEYVTGRRVLELGFGTGELLIEMVERGWQVCGLEPSPAMHRVAARRMRRRGVWAPRVRGFAEALPLADASVDAVVATFPGGYILSPATWREAARVLRPSEPASGAPAGRLIIAGLFFEIDVPLLRRAGRDLHDSIGPRILQRCRELARRTGFQVSVAREEAGRFRVPLLVMERRGPTASGAGAREGHGHVP